MKNMEIREVYHYLDTYTKTLVGVCLKRLDILAPENDELKLTNKQIHCLYKKLIKENMYEQLRAIKKIIEANNVSERIITKSKDS